MGDFFEAKARSAGNVMRPCFCVVYCLYCRDVFRMFFVIITRGKYRSVYCFRVEVGEVCEYGADVLGVSDCYDGGVGHAIADEFGYFVSDE